MRPLIYSMGVSLDGYIAGPRGEGGWAAPDAELHRFHNEQAGELHVVPVLLGQGRRLFEGLAAEQIELEGTRILEGEGGVTHTHYRVQR